MVNNSLYLSSGEDDTVGLDVHITIDCKQLIDDLKDKGELNPTITWTKDGLMFINESVPNVFISENMTLVIITRTTFATGGQAGNDGNYTCKVCGHSGITKDCEEETSCIKVCGEINLF